MRIFDLVLAALFALTLVGAAAAQAIQLRDGSVLVGEIQEVSAEGMVFHRLDTGGMLDLRWEDLSGESAVRIKHLKGLLVEDEDEVTVQADVITYAVQGLARDVIVGILVRETPEEYILQRRGVEYPIKRRDIKLTGKRQVPVYEVYSKEGYYALQLNEIQPGDDADKHILMADALRRAGDYDASLKHLLRAQELGGGNQKSKLPPMLSRLRTLMESETEREMLKEIRVLRNQKRFEDAEARIVQFEAQFPDSRLKTDLEREKRRFEKDRESFMIGQVYQKWAQTLLAVARDKAAEDVDLNTAREYAENFMAQEIFSRIGASLSLSVEEVEQFWMDRHKYSRHGPDLFSYGVGSWLLGKDKILTGTKLDKLGGNTNLKAGESRSEWERITRKMEEIRKRSRQVARRNRDSGPESDEDWWMRSSRNDRQYWLRAYFAENSGYLEVTRAFIANCTTCAGSGSVAVRGMAGGQQKQECSLCRGTRHTRTIRAR
ncbi:MAG: DnaJ-like cysteine-rich domain-containing protein [Planctomycetota bacterium]|jgi:hypothetical protein